MKPYQCSGKSPAYPSHTKSGQDRSRIETNIEICRFSSNTGKFLRQPTWNMGILNLELLNKWQNALKLGSSGYTLISKKKNIKFAQIILLFLIHKYHAKQHNISKSKRVFPQYETERDANKVINKSLDVLFTKLIAGMFGKDELHSTELNINDIFDDNNNTNKNDDSNTRYNLMANCSVAKCVKAAMEQKIINDGLLIKDNKWNQKLTYGLHRLIKKNNWHKQELSEKNIIAIVDKNINTVYKEYRQAGVDPKLICKKLLKDRMFRALKKYIKKK